jgi:superfamily II DNA or RNA helicase
MPKSENIASSAFDRMRDLLLSFPPPVRSRGLQYATTGRVQPLEWTDEGVRAKVRGASIYVAAWRWNGQAWNGACTCPVGRSCKHLYAVGLEILRVRRDDVPGDANDAAAMVELRAASDPWRRTRALSRLVMGSRPELERHVHRAPIAGFLEGTDFDLMCWQIARALARLSGGWLPHALEPWRDRPDLAARERAIAERRLLEELGTWAERATPLDADRSVRILLSVLEGMTPVFALEVRLTSPRLTDEPRTPRQVEQLVSDARRHPGRLPAQQIALLETLLDAEGASSTDWNDDWVVDSPTAIVLDQGELWRFLAQAESQGAVSWHDDTPEAFGVSAGDPVRLAFEPLAIVPECEERDGRLVIDLFVRGAGGLRVRLGDVLHVPADSGRRTARFGIVVHDGALHRLVDRPPDEVVQAFGALDGLALDAGRDVRLVSTLTRAFPELRTSLRKLAAVKPVTPVIAVDLRASDWIQLRVFSVPAGVEWTPDQPPPSSVEEYVPGRGWTSTGDAPPQVHRFELPDDDALTPALAWLLRSGAQQGAKALAGGVIASEEDRAVGWWVPLSARRMATFAAAWAERPPHVLWYCTPRAKRLLVDGPSVRAKVSMRSSGIDFFELSAEWEVEGAKLTPEDFARLANATGPYVRISSGWVRLDTAELATRQAETLAEFGIEAGDEARRLSLWELARARPQAFEELAALGMNEATQREVERLRERVTAFAGLPRIDVPHGFVGTLRHYQQDGLDFLAHASTLGLGAILADDMGLGKTIQALAWLLWLRENDPNLGPALVVCPASVVHNWEREAGVFAPGLRVALVTSGADRAALLERAGEYDLMVTNYSLLRRDIERWKNVPLGAAILDEAQFIKNPDAVVSRAVLELRAKHRLALTGTPLENRALDLWSILAFVEPGLLGTRRQFVEYYDRADAPALRRRMLAARLRPVLLRRLKSDVARDLPPRIEERRDCALGPRQRTLYAAELVAARQEIGLMAAEPDGMKRNKIQILARLTRLRQICCHPALVPAGHGVPAGSGKFEALWELLEPLLAEGQKVLVFSQFVRCLELLAGEMGQRDIPFHMLTGATRKRGEVVTAFEQDERPCVFLISLKAGGTGLNLTAASYVVLFDPWWNPAVEAQAIDRTHRIGQTQTVIAYRMLTIGTIEEKIWELQNRKAALSHELLGEDGFAKTLTREDLAYLLEPAPSRDAPL